MNGLKRFQTFCLNCLFNNDEAYMRWSIYIIICMLFIQACAEEPRDFVPVTPDQKIRTFSHSYDAVWSRLIAYLEKQDIDIKSIDKESGSIITDFIPIDPKSPLGEAVIFPEKGERIIESAKYDMVIGVKKVDEKKTSVQVDVHLSKYSRPLMTYYSWKPQLSNGYIEKKLFEELEKTLKAK